MMKLFLAFILLCSVSFAFDIHEFFPCSFQVKTYTRLISYGQVMATSEDTFYHDHDNLWRWDSTFTGISVILGHEWSIVWRPEYGNSYHVETPKHECLLNAGYFQPGVMMPYPFDFMLEFFSDPDWNEDTVTLSGSPATRITLKGVAMFKTNVVFNMFIRDDEILFANGTIKTPDADYEVQVDINQFKAYQPIPSKVFTTCTSSKIHATTPPADPSAEFRKLCYRNPVTHTSSSSDSFIIKPSFANIFASILMILLFYIAL